MATQLREWAGLKVPPTFLFMLSMCRLLKLAKITQLQAQILDKDFFTDVSMNLTSAISILLFIIIGSHIVACIWCVAHGGTVVQ